MGFIVRFYDDFEKRVNSTKVPTNTVGTFKDFNVNLKDPTNLFAPIITINADDFKDGNNNIINPMNYNYAYIQDFKRYYFVRSWTWLNGIWSADLEIDFLASHKTAIGNTTAYVLRSASSYDADLIDTKYTVKSDCHVAYDSLSSVWHTNINSTSITDGFYVLGIVNNDSGSVGAVSYYAVAGNVLRSFMSQLYASPSWLNITDTSISNDLQKMLINPIQYIISCMFFPLSLQITGQSWTTVSTIPVGWWDITLPSPAVFYKLTNIKLQYDSSVEFTIPKHPSATGAFKWLENSPYSTYQLEFFPYGVFTIDSAKLYGFEKVRCEQKIDLMTGSGTMNVIRKKSGTNYNGFLFSVSSQVGIPISMAQMSVDLSRLHGASTWALSAGLGLASDTSAVSELVNNAKDVVPDVTMDTSASSVMTRVAMSGLGVAGAGNWRMEQTKWSQLGVDTSPRAAVSAILPQVDTSSTGDKLASLLKSAGKVAANIGNAILASSGTCHMMGATGTLAQYYLNQSLILFYFDIVDTDPTHYGYPLSQNKKINTLSGFVLCANDGDLSISGLATERQSIVAAMTGGFYYE